MLSPGASDGVAYGTSYTIRWSDADPDSDAVITLGYDTLGSGCTGTTIAGGISENDPANSHGFDISGLAYGTSYWVYAVIDDGTTPVCSYAGSALVRVDPSTLALTVMKGGTGSGTVTADDPAEDQLRQRLQRGVRRRTRSSRSRHRPTRVRASPGGAGPAAARAAARSR